MKIIFRALGLEEVRQNMAATSSSIEALRMIWELPQEKQVHLVVMMWLWWERRNKIRGGERVESVEFLIHRIQTSTAEYLKLFVSKKETQIAKEVRWIPPHGDYLKINVDGAYTQGNDCGG
uniref:RNase H type-1 domain-containing protein n=1 Tax=Arundo donax TaxID=35708 RepID=A0A0A8ZID7_ARUDO